MAEDADACMPHSFCLVFGISLAQSAALRLHPSVSELKTMQQLLLIVVLYKLQVDSPLGASAVAGEPAASAARKQKPLLKDGSSFLAQQSQGMQRPQDRFEDAVDNSNCPFVHNFEHVQQWQVISSTCGSGWFMQIEGEDNAMPSTTHLILNTFAESHGKKFCTTHIERVFETQIKAGAWH